ncbi:MAG: NUDIX domain-containing protein [Sedimentisphaerales bacterium]|nr:NUDIX domain-containing protein [Sedimentisphaerales bacterium]
MKIFEYCPSCGSKEIYFDNIKMFRCEACSFTFFHNVAAAAAAVLEYEGKILTIKRDLEPAKGKLDLPGGFVDPKETAEEGLRREIKEELNIDLGEMKYLGSYPNIYKYKGVPYNTCDLIFYSKINAFPTQLEKSEIEELVLIDPANIPADKIAFESTIKALELFAKEY